MVNVTYSRQMFPNEDPIGKPEAFNSLPIVGVVRDHKFSNLRWNEAVAYRIARPEGRLRIGLLARTAGDPRPVVPAVRQAIASVHPRLVLSVRTLDDVIAQTLVRERLLASTSLGFATLGVVLAGIGLFGVAAYAVARRSAEIGLRMALGAGRWRILGDSVREAAAVLVLGLTVGLSLAVACTRYAAAHVSGLLFGIGPTDWIALGLSGSVLTIVAVLACLVPAVRATRVDPIIAMRQE